MPDMQPQMPQKASFVRSTWEGIKGFFKGGIAGAVIGAVVIGALAAVAGLIFPAFGAQLASMFGFGGASAGTAASIAANTVGAVGEAAITAAGTAAPAIGHMTGMGLGALGGALAGGAIFSQIGSWAGALTGVLKSREVGQPSAEDIVNVAKISFAQGTQMGVQLGQAQHKQRHFQTALDKQRENVMLAGTQGIQ